MDGADYLYTSAEIAAALAGFAALMVALGDRDEFREFPTYVASLIERSLVAILLSLLPALLMGLDVPPGLVWGVSSGALAVYILSLAIRSLTLRRRTPGISDFMAGPVFYSLYGVGVLVLGLQALHAIDALATQSVWWYLVGLTWLLASVCYLFFSFVRAWARAH